MKLIILFLAMIPGFLWAQVNPVGSEVHSYSDAGKSVIDYDAIKNWPSLRNVKITPNGQYLSYIVSSPQKGANLIVQPMDSSWKKELPGVHDAFFAGPSRYLVFVAHDSIGILTLKTGEVNYILSVKGMNAPKNDNGQWLAWQEHAEKNIGMLVVWDTINNVQTRYSSVSGFTFSENGKVLLIDQQQIDSTHNLLWIDLVRNIQTMIWQSKQKPVFFCFNATTTEVAFATGPIDQQSTPAKLYIARPETTAICVSNQLDHDTFFDISKSNIRFSSNGQQLLFSIQPAFIKKKTTTDAVNVDVWNYKDKELQSQQLNELDRSPENILAIYHMSLNRVTTIKLAEGERLIENNRNLGVNTGWLLLEKATQKPDERQYTLGSGKITLSLISILDNSRKEVAKEQFISNTSTLSPQGKYVVYYNRMKQQYISFDVCKKTRRNITSNIPTPMYSESYHKQGLDLSVPAGEIVGWLPNDTGVLLSDGYDIWQVDLNIFKKPQNITQGFGRRNKLRFQIINTSNQNEGNIYIPGDTILLKGINKVNYKEGYYKMVLGTNQFPICLSKGSYHLNYESRVAGSSWYLLRRETKADAPNWYMTTDFKKFRQLTNLQPQQELNWYSSELIHWKQSDGLPGQGILYKPENFDMTKKHPIIFLIYETVASGIYRFEPPRLSIGAIDVSWYTSRGYLVFEPDIICTMGKPGQSAFNTVISAALYLSKKPWVNNLKMGLSGSSFGGFETNFIITRTKIFTAASSGFGAVDMVSQYGELRGWPEGKDGNQQWNFETSQYRMGATIWEHPELYIRNSPIYMADHVMTPLLILQNKEDGSTPWTQGLEWFNALRRLGKRAWMLQYDGEGHGVHGEKEQVDYSIRQEQFFNHYLKGMAAPLWMTQGIPAKKKGLVTGLELDKPDVIP